MILLFYIFTSSVWAFWLLHKYQIFFIWVVLMSVQSHLTEIYIYLMTNNIEHIFMSVLLIPITLWNFWVFPWPPSSNWVVLLSKKSSLYVFWTQILYQIYWKYFLPFCGLKLSFIYTYIFWSHLAAACRLFIPNQGLNPCSLQWKRQVLTMGPPGKSFTVLINSILQREEV